MTATSPTATLTISAMQRTRVAIAVVQDGEIRTANPAFWSLFDAAADLLAALRPLLAEGGEAELELATRVGGRAGGLLFLSATADRMQAPGGPPAWAVTLRERDPDGPSPAAEQDPLTGALNRRGFERRLAEAAARARRHGRPLSLAIVDLDHFKRINDGFGHPVGDEVLREAVRRLQATARLGDVVGRVGGEEFAWLLSDADAGQGIAAADRARAAFAERPFAEGIALTASVGVCDLGAAGDLETLYLRADQALYWAKRHGRDTTLAWSEPASRALQAGAGPAAPGWGELLRIARSSDAAAGGSGGHGDRVAEVAVALAIALGWPPYQQARLHQAARVHDVGKIAIPPALLPRRRRPTPAEQRHLRQHAGLGASLVADALDEEPAGWIRGHHERWDGAGYPDGLSGSGIPEGAQLLAIADRYATRADPAAGHADPAALRAVDRCAGTTLRPDAGVLLRAALAWLDGRGG